MIKKNILILFQDGEIEILGVDDGHVLSTVYHKSYNPGETIKDNLLKAFDDWSKRNENNA